MHDINIAWFRQDLRLQDNPMLAAAAAGINVTTTGSIAGRVTISTGPAAACPSAKTITANWWSGVRRMGLPMSRTSSVVFSRDVDISERRSVKSKT